MKVGLINIEPKVFNTAYMQIASYHKQCGDIVSWWIPLTDNQFDKVYCSSLFDFTNKSEVPKRTICGGTGFDITSRLPAEIENCDLDYSIYPQCRTSYLWFSRGCIRNCPWCIVPQKEGRIHTVPPKNLNPNGKYITIMDNNFFANPEWRTAVDWLDFQKNQLDFQGIDARILTEEMCIILNKFWHYKQIKIAWDDPRENLKSKLQEITRFIKPYKLMCYVLIGYWYFLDGSAEEKDLYRVETLRGLGIDPFVMPYDRSDLYQKAFARWVNHKAIFKKVKWEDYNRRVMKQEIAGRGWNKMR